MKHLLAIIIITLFAITPLPTKASVLTGLELLEALENGRGPFVDYAMGYARGVADWSNGICVPQGVTNGQLLRIVKKYLEDNPKDLNMDAETLIFLVLVIDYSCEE